MAPHEPPHSPLAGVRHGNHLGQIRVLQRVRRVHTAAIASANNNHPDLALGLLLFCTE
jgi:hypothetical protein